MRSLWVLPLLNIGQRSLFVLQKGLESQGWLLNAARGVVKVYCKVWKQVWPFFPPFFAESFCWQLLFCCRSSKGWWTCWTGCRPGTAPPAAQETQSWRRWPRSACVSSQDTSTSRTRRSAAPTIPPVEHANSKMSLLSQPKLLGDQYQQKILWKNVQRNLFNLISEFR